MHNVQLLNEIYLQPTALCDTSRFRMSDEEEDILSVALIPN